ncbi:hypothetical protein POM88_021017 [Heracleum sosnowskyi]|uniref:Replication protein A 70 kDa DNA-binding subunit B/D first OB fold domain-containing protein n=1 Tax=Heracleum sosnowskyi TaxID=360622 RepID=A0AAD8MSF0_9APIA|nr:hypothetical protein POM88_021017 [Heracleum sosnowskyi]
MTFNKYDILSDIETKSFKWNCRVRAQAIWKGISRETQQCFGINIIFLDDSNNRIHAFINHKYVEQLEEQIIEREIYALSNFKVKKYLDVAGIVQNGRPMVSTIKNGVETKWLMFDISDGRYNLKVTLFNEIGKANESVVLSIKDAPVVIIIDAAKITTYDGKILHLIILPQNYMSKKLMDISSDEEEETKNFITIKQFQALGKEFVQCKIEVFREAGRYKCTNCKRTIPHPDKRFRDFTLCLDKTGRIGIIFPDTEVRRIIQKSVFDIHAEYIEEPIEEPFPDILRQLHHKDYIVTVLLSEENIINGSAVYEAIAVDNEIERSDNFSSGKQITEKELDMSIINDNQTPIVLKDTPQIGKSTNWKTGARKNIAPVLYDSDEILPTKAQKNIKTEPLDPSS